MKNLIILFLFLFLFLLCVTFTQAQDYEALQRDFLTPEFQDRYLGTPYLTRQNIENNLGILPVRKHKNVLYYELVNVMVGLEYNSVGICVKSSFRLMGEEALNYEGALLEIFEPVKVEDTFSVEMDSFKGVSSESILYVSREVACRVYRGSYRVFTFYTIKNAGKK